MLNKNKPYMTVQGFPGVTYEQRQDDGPNKLYNGMGFEVKTKDGDFSATIIEKLPEGVSEAEAKGKPEPSNPTTKDDPVTLDSFKDSALTVHERIRIADEKDPNYMTEEDIRGELEGRNASFDKRMGRPKLAAILKHELGE
jgi:hypothetical protein